MAPRAGPAGCRASLRRCGLAPARRSAPNTLNPAAPERPRRTGRRSPVPAGRPTPVSPPPSRTAKTRATGSAIRRRATKAECLHRHLVEPLRVVDDAEQGLIIGGGRHQAQHRQPDQEAVRGRPDAAAESDVQRLALRFRQLVDVIHQRRAQLLQAGECELHIGLNACHLRLSGNLTPALKRTRATRSCRHPPLRGAPAPGSYPIGQSRSDPEASRIRWRDRADFAPDPGST